MKNLSIVCCIAFLAFLSACNKESLPAPEQINDAPSELILVDWVTGNKLLTVQQNSNTADERSPTTYYNNMSGATTKFGFQGDVYQNGILIISTGWYWYNAGSSVSLGFGGDCANEYRFVMHYLRKLPGTPCNLTINWSTTPGGASANETFTIGPSGTTKSYQFYACE